MYGGGHVLCTLFEDSAQHSLHHDSCPAEALQLHNELHIFGSSIHQLTAVLGPAEHHQSFLTDTLKQTCPSYKQRPRLGRSSSADWRSLAQPRAGALTFACQQARAKSCNKTKAKAGSFSWLSHFSNTRLFVTDFSRISYRDGADFIGKCQCKRYLNKGESSSGLAAWLSAWTASTHWASLKCGAH